LNVAGLYAILSSTSGDYQVSEELQVRITRMDPDEGRIFVSDSPVATGQLPLI
jgi:hypothetical protein